MAEKKSDLYVSGFAGAPVDGLKNGGTMHVYTAGTMKQAVATSDTFKVCTIHKPVIVYPSLVVNGVGGTLTCNGGSTTLTSATAPVYLKDPGDFVVSGGSATTATELYVSIPVTEIA